MGRRPSKAIPTGAVRADARKQAALMYARAGHTRKAAEWLRRARNLAETAREKARWSRRLDELLAGADPP